MTGIIDGVISVPTLAFWKAAAGGKTICCSASWLWTFELAKLYAHRPRLPATMKKIVSPSPTMESIPSNVLRFMVVASQRAPSASRTVPTNHRRECGYRYLGALVTQSRTKVPDHGRGRGTGLRWGR